MKNLPALGILLIMLILGILSLLFFWPQTPRVETIDTPASSTPEQMEPEPDPRSIIGSLFMIGHWANTPVASTTALIRDHQVGGVIIMSAPEDPMEISSWIEEWNAVSDAPLLIAIDQEGGPVSRLKGADFIQTGQREITTTQQAYEVGLTRGQELADLGINMVFAPVLDSAKNPDSFMFSRVFPDQTDAATLGVTLSRGLEDGGVTPVAKHFPGHDDTSDDSHLMLPTVQINEAQLPMFIRTFTNYIASYQPAAIMTAHVLFPQIDDKPATLSSYFLQDLLRSELQHSGMIVTDDMSMDAIDENWTSSEATIMALEAGADLILFAAEPATMIGAYQAVEAAVTDGRLSFSLLQEKSDRTRSLP